MIDQQLIFLIIFFVIESLENFLFVLVVEHCVEDDHWLVSIIDPLDVKEEIVSAAVEKKLLLVILNLIDIFDLSLDAIFLN